MKSIPKKVYAAIVAAFMSAACTGPNIQQSTDKELEAGATAVGKVRPRLEAPVEEMRGSSRYAENKANEQKQMPVMRKTSKSWVGAVMVPVNADDKLPQVFYQDYTLNFADRSQQASISTVAARLSQMVGMPVRIQPDVYASAVATDASGVRRLPPVTGVADEAPSANVSVAGASPLNINAIQMKWNGTLKDFLDHLTDRLGLSWAYRDNSIVIMRFTTEVYELASYPSGYDYSLTSGTSGQVSSSFGSAGGPGGMPGGAGGGGAGSRGFRSATNLTINEQGKVEGVMGILNVVQKMIAGVPGSEAYMTDGSGRLVVKTNRDMQTQIREFVRAENTNMLKQVQIQLDIYSVMSNNDDQLGIDWSIFYNKLSRDNVGLSIISPATLVGPNTGSVTLRANGGNFINSQSVVSALSQLGRNVQHRPVSLIALNRQWARKAKLTSTGYLAQTIPAVVGLGGGSGLPGLVTDSVTTGDQFAVMPFVLDSNTVMLKFGISLSDLLALFTVSSGQGPTLQSVQTPNTSTISDQFTVALRPGEVMAITGLSREVASTGQRSFSENISVYAGGSRTISKMQEHFIVFLRVISV
ncbi:MAG: hypothetical protein LW629_00275 [Burkholderiales bacterium]|jgi:type IVB pilus formation R64 PilN family outer membrane protein|nr:hypothetical protein [Burkholderiales bacterium]